MGDLVRWMLSKAHDTHLSQHSALTQRDIWWWNQENTTHTHTHDSAPSNEGPVNTICWWGRASQTVTYSSMESAVLCLHFHQGNPSWDDYKETYREQQAKCSHWKPQEHAIPSWHKPPGHTLASLQGLGHYWLLDPHPEMGSIRTHRTGSKRLLHLSQQKVSQFSWSLHRKLGSFTCGFQTVPTGNSWIFCSSFLWLLRIIYPFSSVCSDVFHITSDIFSFHISYNIFIIFSRAIPFWKQITFSQHFGTEPKKMPERNVMKMHVAILPCNAKLNSFNMEISCWKPPAPHSTLFSSPKQKINTWKWHTHTLTQILIWVYFSTSETADVKKDVKKKLLCVLLL